MQRYLLKPILIDLSVYDDEELKKHEEMAPIDLILKYTFCDYKLNKMPELFTILASANKEIQYQSVKYLMRRVGIPQKKFLETAVNQLNQEVIMTVAEQLEQRGREQARAEFASVAEQLEQRGREQVRAEFASVAEQLQLEIRNEIAKFEKIENQLQQEIQEMNAKFETMVEQSCLKMESIARKLFDLGLDYKDIKFVTGLKPTELKKIKRQTQKL